MEAEGKGGIWNSFALHNWFLPTTLSAMSVIASFEF